MPEYGHNINPLQLGLPRWVTRVQFDKAALVLVQEEPKGITRFLSRFLSFCNLKSYKFSMVMVTIRTIQKR